ncbi:MAG: Ca-activated chloride channel [Acidobacteriota bacterium]|jgi:VWFA-related protein|nr:Ca-activated chloride channel [Acidobacteriota bacterium]
MKRLAVALVLSILPLVFVLPKTTAPQSRPRIVGPKETAIPVGNEEVIKTDIDLVVLDALVLQKKTGRVVGDLKREDFALVEDGVVQQITHFSQNSLPLSVLLLIDRGGCLDPFGENVRHAARESIAHLKPADELAVMAYHNSTDLVQEFTRDRQAVSDALDRVPGHDEEANHCLDTAFYEAARYMNRAGNPVGRRVIIVITGVTSNFDCQGDPSVGEAKREVYESGSVVCGLIPRSAGQRAESGMMRAMTGIAGAVGVPTLRVNDLAEETGGEVLDDKPENLDRTFDTLVEHLRTRYQLAFVPTNRKHDGTVRKLKLTVKPTAAKSQGKLAVKTRRSYTAPKS